MRVKAFNIDYDATPQVQCTLPDEFILEVPAGFNVADDGAELISEQTGWLVHSFNYEELTCK